MTNQESMNPTLRQRLIATTVLLDYARLNKINDSDSDIAVLYRQISLLHAKANNDNERAFEIIDQHDLYDITSVEKTRDRIQKMKSQTPDIFTPYQIDQAANKNLLASVLHENGISKSEAQQLAQHITEKTLHEDYKRDFSWARKLYLAVSEKAENFRQSLAEDYITYLDKNYRDPAVEQLKENILMHVQDVTFSVDIAFDHHHTPDKLKDYLRNDCNGVSKNASNVKSKFYELYGTMISHGMNLVKGNESSGYGKFCDIMQKNYGKNYLQVIDMALNNGKLLGRGRPEFSEAERIEKFNTKCQSLYFKTMAGLLNQKLSYDNPHIAADYRDYVKTLEGHYLRGLCQGCNNIRALGIQDIDDREVKSKKEEHKIARELGDETAERKIVSYHHKFPVGSAQDAAEYFKGKAFTAPDEFGNITSEMEKFCAQLINNLGNGCAVIGKKQHNIMEPRNNYTMTAQADDTFMAAEIEPKLFKQLEGKIPDYLWNGIKRYASVTQISESFYLPEGEDIRKVRNSLSRKQDQIRSRRHSFSKLIEHHFGAPKMHN